MSGHNKWTQIKRKKEKTDSQKAKIFGKYSKFITEEARKANGNLSSPGLKAVIDRAKEDNTPADIIERAIKKATEKGAALERATYEAYGPGGVALIIEVLTDSKNRAAQEVKAILTRHELSLAGQGSASWAFQKQGMNWIPTTTTPISDEDGQKLSDLIEAFEENDDVQEVFTNAE